MVRQTLPRSSKSRIGHGCVAVTNWRKSAGKQRQEAITVDFVEDTATTGRASAATGVA